MISDVYDSTVELFKRYGCPAQVFLGPQWLDQYIPPLSVVLYQTRDQFGEQVASYTPTQRGLYVNPRPLATRACGFTARLWATAPTQRNSEDQYRADLAWLDALVNQFVIALRYIGAGISSAEGGMAAKGNAAADVSGLGYELECRLDIPIIDAPWPAQGLDNCSQTWRHARATAEITVSGKVDPEPPFYQPGIVFPVPTPEE